MQVKASHLTWMPTAYSYGDPLQAGYLGMGPNWSDSYVDIANNYGTKFQNYTNPWGEDTAQRAEFFYIKKLEPSLPAFVDDPIERYLDGASPYEIIS